MDSGKLQGIAILKRLCMREDFDALWNELAYEVVKVREYHQQMLFPSEVILAQA